ncbi:hypothetical protein G6L37_07490 [Agrobacterium rubi]|nr:hypothetical protein [Agrobacterium rubi]NTF25211.1 hypothetical protein [Agrobacterium rubi]
MARTTRNQYAEEPHVRVRYSVWDMEPPTSDASGIVLVPQPLIDAHGLRAAFLFTSGFHHRYISLVETGQYTFDGARFDPDPVNGMRP